MNPVRRYRGPGILLSMAVLGATGVHDALAGPCDVPPGRPGFYSFTVEPVGLPLVHERDVELPTGRDSVVRQRIVVDFVSVIESTSLVGKIEDIAAQIDGMYQGNARLLDQSKRELRRKVTPLLQPGQEFEVRGYRFTAVRPGAGYTLVGRDTINEGGRYITHAVYARQVVEDYRASATETIKVVTDLKIEAQGMVVNDSLVLQVNDLSANVRPLPGNALSSVKAVNHRKLQLEASRELAGLRARLSKFYPLAEGELRDLCPPGRNGALSKHVPFEFLGQPMRLPAGMRSEYKTIVDGELGGPGR